MEKELTIDRVLEFYDVPALYTAHDGDSTTYLCLTHDVSADGDVIGTAFPVTDAVLEPFLHGRTDLLDLFMSASDLFDVTISVDGVHAIPRESPPEPDMMPARGYFFHGSEKTNGKGRKESKD